MGRKRSRLTEQCLVPFEAACDVGYPYDRPRALHWSLSIALDLLPANERLSSSLYQRQDGGGRVAFQPVVHKEEEELLVLAGAADQHFHRFACLRVRVLHVGVRGESVHRFFV